MNAKCAIPSCDKPATQKTIGKALFVRCETHMAELFCGCGATRTHLVTLQDGQQYNLCRRCVMVAAGHDDTTARNRATPEAVKAALALIAEQLRKGIIPDAGTGAAAMLSATLAKRKGERA